MLRFSALPVQDWGFQVRRFIDARQETDDWAFYPRSAATLRSAVRPHRQPRDLQPAPPIELRPFVLGRVGYRTADADTTLTHGWSADGSAGLDAKAHVTNELTLDLAVNPDFGQVEADTVVLNLSTYETFFPEKRPFFLEGIDVFSTVRPLVYTRRIGQQPATPTLTQARTLVANPEPAPLYGAAKLVGHDRRAHDRRPDLGDHRSQRRPRSTRDGVREERRLEPWTTFNVLRVKRKLAANAEVGVLATAANRFETPMPAGTICPVSGAPTARTGAASTTPTWSAPTAAGDRRRETTRSAWQAVGVHDPERAGAPAARRHTDRARARSRRARSLYVGKEGGAPLDLERLAAPRGARAGVQRHRLPGTQERLPGVRWRSPTGRWSPGGARCRRPADPR